MLLSKTPLRISFVGGGSDYFNNKSNVKGRVISVSINKYLYVTLNKRYNNQIRAAYSETEIVNSTNDLKHNIIRESLKKYSIKNGVELTTIADVPSSGSGLASSSALSVGLAHSLRKFKKLKITKKTLAEDACDIEINKCKKPIGMQDQYSTAFGGLNKIEFSNNKVIVKKIPLNDQDLTIFKNHLMLFYTGINRQADKILTNIKKSGNQFKNYEELSYLAKNFEKELLNKNFQNCGEILHENWNLKRSLDKSVSSINLDNIYSIAKKSGAVGGKILGAGGGGYFLFLVKPKYKKKMKNNLKKLQEINFNFTKDGSRLIEV
ncbi:hypothetical protein AKH21_02215 [Pelagibacteraceae bacterium GOM-A5]|nr:hypothetical protein AKH21_02215 [Pelagibacteraceae bacterium GOM-A5]